MISIHLRQHISQQDVEQVKDYEHLLLRIKISVPLIRFAISSIGPQSLCSHHDPLLDHRISYQPCRAQFSALILFKPKSELNETK